MTNVEALELALEEAGRRGHIPWQPGWSLRNAARLLAASGCLQVDSLTDEQADGIIGAAESTYQDLRDEIRRCATGEAE